MTSSKEAEIKRQRPDFRIDRSTQGIGFHKKLVYLTASWTAPVSCVRRKHDEKCTISRSCSKATAAERREEILDEVLQRIELGEG